MIRTGARGYADGTDVTSVTFLLVPLTSLRFSPSWRYGHWLTTGTQLRQSRDESQGSYRIPNQDLYLTLLDRSGSFRRQKVHLPCNFRGTRGK